MCRILLFRRCRYRPWGRTQGGAARRTCSGQGPAREADELERFDGPDPEVARACLTEAYERALDSRDPHRRSPTSPSRHRYRLKSLRRSLALPERSAGPESHFRRIRMGTAGTACNASSESPAAADCQRARSPSSKLTTAPITCAASRSLPCRASVMDLPSHAALTHICRVAAGPERHPALGMAC